MSNIPIYAARDQPVILSQLKGDRPVSTQRPVRHLKKEQRGDRKTERRSKLGPDEKYDRQNVEMRLLHREAAKFRVRSAISTVGRFREHRGHCGEQLRAENDGHARTEWHTTRPPTERT
jgi:hypothetical protein